MAQTSDQNDSEEGPTEMKTPEENSVEEEKTLPLQQRIWSRLKLIASSITVEPILFLFMFGNACRMVSYQDFLITKSCEKYLNASRQECSNLTHNEYLNKESQKYGANYYMIHTLMATLPSTVAGAFLGPWSDKYGRRYPIIISFTALLIESILELILVASDNTPLILLPLCSLISSISGGVLIIGTACLSYMCDITNEKNRAVRYGIVEFVYSAAAPLGTLVGGQIFKFGGYIGVFLVNPCTIALCLVWVLFFLKETIKKLENADRKSMFKDLISTKNLKDCVQTCLRKRPGNLRAQLWLVMLTIGITMLAFLGSFSVGYPHAKIMYRWDVTVYSNVLAIFKVTGSVATVLFIPLMIRVVKIQDGMLGIIGCLSIIAENVLKSVAFVPWVYYYGKITGALHSCVSIAVKTRLPKLVDRDEIGKVFSLLGVFQSVVPMIGTSLSALIYTHSVDFFPGLVYALTAGLVLIPISIFIWMIRQPEPSIMKELQVKSKDKETETAETDEVQETHLEDKSTEYEMKSV